MSATYGTVDVLLIIAFLTILCAPLAALDQHLYVQVAYCAVLIPSVLFLFLWIFSVFVPGAISMYTAIAGAFAHVAQASSNFDVVKVRDALATERSRVQEFATGDIVCRGGEGQK